MSKVTVLTREVKKLMQKWIKSYEKRDTAFLEQYLSDDYLSTFPDGAVLDKKGEIESVKSGAVVFSEIPSKMKVRIYGETAVITGRSTIRAKVKSQDGRGVPLYPRVDQAMRPLAGRRQLGDAHRRALSESYSPKAMVMS